MNLLPEPLRGLGYRLVLKRQGRGVFYDAGIYIKFPWLVEIGDNVSLNRGVEIYPSLLTGHGVRIGNDVTLWSGNHIGHDSVIEDHCFITSHVVVSGHVRVGTGSFLGVNATLRNDITIGPESLIVAGAVITKNTPAKSVFYPERAKRAPKSSDEIEL